MKKIFAVLLGVTLLLALTACGEVDTPTTEPTGETTTQPTAQTDAPTEPTGDDVFVPTETVEKTPEGEESIEDIKARIEPASRSFTYDDQGNLIRICADHEELQYTAEYDEKGRIIREEDYYNGEVVTDSSYEYLPDGGWKKIHYGTGGNTENTYDAQGKLLLSVSYQDITESYRAEYTYNEHGDVSEMKESYDPSYFDGEFLYTYEYEYDEKGNWVKKSIYRNGELEQYFLRTYNEENLLTEETEYYSTGEEAVREAYSYDKENRLVETLCYDEEKLLYIETCSYDENGRLVEELTYYVGS